ncbi:adenylate/guanylate cyclase domain-containing protein [Piscinibacter sakaiensis]|uniref:Adenylate cyclase n=1 Tax=Piscinibacter sakaiensis TaxID=1547922 RepID=A0A0K8NW28_PISS1|nr:adenylate/guanylate cyclase domain-containing protein [Piscinibacter sakaiensis]GAP34602.1 adenylate cyclase [Piscinibacter sakaiensis]
MTPLLECTVLFADLRGSTGLFERMGNARAGRLVVDHVQGLCDDVEACGGRVVKTLGDGLMARFARTAEALAAVDRMRDRQLPDFGDRPDLKLQIALARGEVVELGGDCFGDAVNVAARLLDHTGDNELLATGEVIASLGGDAGRRFRSLGPLRLRGRAESVVVYLMTPGQGPDFAVTAFDLAERAPDPDGLRLSFLDVSRVFGPHTLPVVLGRSTQATYCVEDSRVSRLHARIEWQGGAFQLIDLSYNGSYVRFGRDGQIVTLRRSHCTLHGSGTIGLGTPPSDPFAPCLHFEVLRFNETQPLPLARRGNEPPG